MGPCVAAALVTWRGAEVVGVDVVEAVVTGGRVVVGGGAV